MKFSLLALVIVLVAGVGFGIPAYAAETGTANSVEQGTANTVPATSGATFLVNPLKIDSLPALLNTVVDAVLELGVIVLILAFVWVGFSFVRAQGNPEALKKARAAFFWTIVGGAILLGAKAIADLINATVQSL